MIKLIVSDMDGTLLDDKNKISKENKEALLKCQEKGIKLILASGRSFNRLKDYGEELKMAFYGGKYIEVNGMAIYDLKTNKREVIKRLKREEIVDFYNFFVTLDIEMQAYFDDGIHYFIPESLITAKEKEIKERNLAKDHPLIGGPWSNVTDNRDGYPNQRRIYSSNELNLEFYNKFNIVSDPSVIDKYNNEIYKFLNDKYEAVRTCPRMIEITPKGITKGETLRRIMKECGYRQDEVVVFGDGENDVDMFNSVYYSYAMENAEDFIKAQANFLAPKNTQSAIAKVLNELILK